MSIAVILQIIAGVGGLVTLWAKQYFSVDSVAARKKEAADAAIQKVRTALQDGDTDAIVTRIDGVLTDEAAAGDSDAGSAGSGLESGSPDTVQRLADFGIRNE